MTCGFCGSSGGDSESQMQKGHHARSTPGEVEFAPCGSQGKLWLWAVSKSRFWKLSLKSVPLTVAPVCYLTSAVNPFVLKLAMMDSVLFFDFGNYQR